MVLLAIVKLSHYPRLTGLAALPFSCYTAETGKVVLFFLKVIWFAHPRQDDEIGKRVRIPRCRATVSEETDNRSLGNSLGRPVVNSGW
jgi:hypothetical protein